MRLAIPTHVGWMKRRNMIKKRVCTWLILLLAISLLAGCTEAPTEPVTNPVIKSLTASAVFLTSNNCYEITVSVTTDAPSKMAINFCGPYRNPIHPWIVDTYDFTIHFDTKADEVAIHTSLIPEGAFDHCSITAIAMPGMDSMSTEVPTP